MRRLMAWDGGSLISKAKATHTEKAKLGIHLPLPMGGQVFSYPQGSRAPSHVMETWEDKCYHSEHPPYFLFPPVLYAKHDTVRYGRRFGQVGITVPALCVPSQFFVQPQPTLWWSEVRSRKALDSTCKHCSAVTNISVWPALQHNCTSAKHSPIFAAMKKITPCQPKPAHSDVLLPPGYCDAVTMK